MLNRAELKRDSVYEDRVKHVKSFEVDLGKYADTARHSDGRRIQVEVKQVAELTV